MPTISHYLQHILGPRNYLEEVTSIFNGLEQKLGTLNEIRCGFLKYILQIHMCVCVLGPDVKGHGIKVATEKKL